ncbi:MAG: cytochrome c4 [Gammaproteobacteria bacterium]|nr:cytochrome c4 [Gammaproteobacteria bacterium]
MAVASIRRSRAGKGNQKLQVRSIALRNLLFLSLVASLTLAQSNASAEGDAEAGKAKSATCTACHGVDGNSVNPEWPKIAGQHASYTVLQLQAYKDGKRQNALMMPMAMGLSDADMQDLAAYYASQQTTPGMADPELVATGERVYRGGNPSRGVPACIACHGPAGKGNPLTMYPKLAGQHAVYTYLQLKAYADQVRKSDKNQMMRNIADRMSDSDMRAVASYIEGLR